MSESFSHATRDALASVLFRHFGDAGEGVTWEELVAANDPFVAHWLDAADTLLREPLFRIIAGAISFPDTLQAHLSAFPQTQENNSDD